MYGASWERVTVDTRIHPGPVLLAGVVLLTSVTGGEVTIYNGDDAESGTPVLRVEGIADESKPVMFPWPLRLERGLFVDVGSNVTEVLVAFVPAALDGSNPAYGGLPVEKLRV
jgi:hypothetical protein